MISFPSLNFALERAGIGQEPTLRAEPRMVSPWGNSMRQGASPSSTLDATVGMLWRALVVWVFVLGLLSIAHQLG